MSKILQKIRCFILGHYWDIAMGADEGDRYITTYVCDCGKRRKEEKKLKSLSITELMANPQEAR